MLCTGWPATAQSPPVERIVPAVQTISTGDAYAQFDVTVESVSNLGAYEVLLQYESTVLAFPGPGDGFAGAENGTFLESSGRTATCQPPIVNDVPATTQKQLRFGCNTTGTAPGASGSGTLATIRLKPVAIGVSALALSPSLSDPLGNDLFAVAISGAVTVTSGPTSTPTVTNTPCPGGGCPTPTPTMPAAATCAGATAPTICFDPASAIGHPGVEMTVDVDVAAVSNLGAVNFVAQYDPSLLDFVGFAAGPFLGSTNRSLFCLPATVGGGSIDQTCVTLGSSPDGPDGDGIIGRLSFVPRRDGTGTLHFVAATLLTPNAQPIPPSGAVAAADADVTVVDCTSPCVTVTPSPTPTQSPTATPSQTPTPSQTATPCAGVCPTETDTATVVPFTPTPTPGEMSVALNPASQTVAQAAPFVVDVDVSGASNVGAFQFTLRYDSDRLLFVDTQSGAFLGSTGRTVQCNAPIVSAGAATFGCFSYGSGASQAGAAGAGTLARVTLEGCSEGLTQLALSGVVVITPSTQPLPLATVSGADVTISPGSGGCPAPSTPTETATPGGATPTATPDTSSAQGSIAPAMSTVMPGDRITVAVNVDDVSNLGAYEFLLTFAPDSPPLMLQFADVQDGGFLASTGRSVFCQPALVTVISVRFGCATSGSPAGPSGGGTLARVTLDVTNYGTAPLSLDLFQLSDPLGGAIASHVTGGSVTSVAAATATASSTPAATSTGTAVATSTDTAMAADTPVPPSTDTATATPTDTATPSETTTHTATTATQTATDTATVTETPAGLGAGAFSSGEPPPGLRSGTHGDEPTQGGNVKDEPRSRRGRDALALASWILGASVLAGVVLTAMRRSLTGIRVPKVAHARRRARFPVLAVLLAAGGLLVPLVALGDNPPGAVIYKSPSSGNVFIGGSALVFTENVAGADRGIAGFELRLRYDQEFVGATFSLGPLLSTGGRTAMCETTPLHPGDVVFACTSSGTAPPSAGPGTLAFINVAPAPGLRIRATKDNGIATVLDDALAGTRLFDENGDDIAVGQVTDANLIVRALEGDVNSDCLITVIDDQSMALRYPSVLGSLIYDRFHDLEPAIAPDDDIDIKDLQFVFGRNGSTCEHPIPEQPTPTPIETPGTPVMVTRTAVATRTATSGTQTPGAGTQTPGTGTQTPGTGTQTPRSGTPTPRTRTPPATGTATTPTPAVNTPTAVATATATTRPSSSATASAAGTSTAGASASPTRGARTQTPISTVEAGSRGPSELPRTGGADFPGGPMGGVLVVLVGVLLIGAYTLERGRGRRS